MTDDLTLIAGGQKISGWTSIRVTRGIERVPADFEIEMTEVRPDESEAFVVKPADFCKVLLGNDVVITGYVDRVMPAIDVAGHAIRVSGRGKCADLIDCAAEWPNCQISSEDVLGIAQILARPYSKDNGGIEVHADVDTTARIQQFNLMQGETPMAIIDRLCRIAALLAYETAEGNLLLTRASTMEAASGFTQGKNVQGAALTHSVDQRYSEVYGYIQRFSSFNYLGEDQNLRAVAYDPNVPRHRRRVILAEAGDADFQVLADRVAWEVARRSGRSRELRLTTDSWRDKDGKLWAPNTLVPISLPALKVDAVKWLISEVTFRRDGATGTTCDLVIMPPNAFLPEPIVQYVPLRGVDPVVLS